MLADPIFYVMVVMFIIGAMAGLMIISQASPIAQEIIGVDPAMAAFAVSCVAIANTCGRIIWGWVSDAIGRFNALPIMYVISGVSMFLLTTVGNGHFAFFVVVVMLIGFCFGGFMGVFPALTADSFGPKNNGVNYGIMFFGFAIGAYVGPVLAATTKAANNGAYTNAFLIAAALSIVGIILTFVMRSMRKNADKKQLAEAK